MNEPPSHILEGGVLWFRRAAELLHWDGMVIPSLAVLGSDVCVVASLNVEEHENRQEAGIGPLCDPWILSLREGATAKQAAHWRVSPVKVAGVLARRQSWQTALTVASGFAAFSSRAVMLPSKQARNRRLTLEAGVCGVGIIARDADSLMLMQQPSPALAGRDRRSLAHRLVEETVYERLLASLVEVG
jgi:hypothetical protein